MSGVRQLTWFTFLLCCSVLRRAVPCHTMPLRACTGLPQGNVDLACVVVDVNVDIQLHDVVTFLEVCAATRERPLGVALMTRWLRVSASIILLSRRRLA